MTTAAVAIRARAERLRVAVSADALALGGLAVFSLGLLALVWGTWGDLDSDTGYDLVAGIRMADGEVLYRDLTYFYGPLAPALAALAVLAGGSSLGSAVALGLVVAGAIVLGTYALARTLVEPLGAFLAAALTAAVALIPNNYSFVIPHTHAATLGTLGLLAMLLCAYRYAQSERASWLVLAGASIGLVALTKPEPLAAAAVAAGIWLVLRAFDGARFRREALLLLAPALAIPALVYGAFAAVAGARTLVLENLYPVDFLDAAGNAMLENRMPMTASSFAEVGGKLALYVAGCAALVLVGARIAKGGRLGRLLVAACVVGGLLFVAGSLVKPDGLRDGMYYLYGWIPAGAVIALALLVRRYRRRDGAWTPQQQVELATAAVLAVLAFTTYASFVVHGWRPQMAVYYLPFAAVLLARLHLVELARSRPGYVLGVRLGCVPRRCCRRADAEGRRRRVGNRPGRRRLAGRSTGRSGALPVRARRDRDPHGTGRADPRGAVDDRPLPALGPDEPAARALAAPGRAPEPSGRARRDRAPRGGRRSSGDYRQP